MFKLCASSIVSWANYFLYQIEKKLDVGFDLVPSFYQRKRRNSWIVWEGHIIERSAEKTSVGRR